MLWSVFLQERGALGCLHKKYLFTNTEHCVVTLSTAISCNPIRAFNLGGKRTLTIFFTQ